MLTKSYIYFTAVLLSMAIFVLAGCGGASTSQNGQGAISAKLVWNSDKTAAKSVASAVTGVATVRLAISGVGRTTVQQDFPAASGSGTLSGVPVGSGLTVTAAGLDPSGAIIYQGSVSNVTVLNGQTTDVGTITMTSAGTVAGTYTGTVSGGTPTTFTGTVAADGTMTGFGSGGDLVIGTVNTTTGTFTMTLPATPTNGNAQINVIGSINLYTGVLTGTWSTISPSNGQTYSGTISGTRSFGTGPATPYSNASLSGVWFTSQLGTNGDPLYLVFDGAGTISDMSGFNLSTPPGTYTVNADGAYSMPFGFATFTGNLTSSTAGTVTYSGLGSNGTLTKVADLSKCQGSYMGTVSWGTSSYAISFSVDSTGIISSFSSNIPGVTTITSSKFFSLADGTAIFMIRTNATSVEFKQMKGWGTLVNGNFTGTLALDTNQGDGTVTLTKN